VKNQDKIINLENENLNKNGESIFLLTNGIPIYNDNHKLIGYFGTDKNITKEKNLYNQLIHSEKLSSIGVMSSALAHEFNNILTIMSTSIQMLELKSQENKNCNFENCNLKNIQKQIIKAKELISNVKNFSRVTNEQKEKIILNDLFNEIIKLEQINCKNKNIKIILENKSNTKLFLNSGHFQQVILNLFENSFYALRNKNHGTIKIKIEENKDNIIILFSDDGEGIPEKNKDKIFNSFFTSKNNKTEEINGTGLGMYVSQEIINSYNGNISVKSEINKGTEFIITIPIKINL
jgi:signal transduction histidine kinase